MNKIYKEINEQTNGKYKSLRFPKATFSKVGVTVTVVCKKEDRQFVETNKSELIDLLTKTCAFHSEIKLAIDDSDPTASGIRSAVVAFTEKFTYVSSVLHTISAEVQPEYKVKIKMHRAMYDLAKNDYIVRLNEFLSDNYAVQVNADIEIVEFSESGTVYSAKVDNGIKEYDVTDIRPVVGEIFGSKARTISSIDANGYNMTVCGIFAMPTAFRSKGGRRYERFLLYDGETSLQCRYSPQTEADSIVNRDLTNKTVCVFGNVEYDSARNEASVSVRALALCACSGPKIVEKRPAPQKYERIIPKPYEEYVQSSMFDSVGALPPALRGGFVVFDFETTGLSILYDRPTELGAVKLVDGRITETFSTLIDPRRPIPPEVVEKTGITDEMVKGQPLFEDVLPDFYKFSEGCSFVCHNIAFDFPFLLKGGNRSGWAFGDRKTFDTMAIAPIALPGIPKLSLDKVLEGLGLVNDNAHRAMSDAAATAKAFAAMHRLLAEKDVTL